MQLTYRVHTYDLEEMKTLNLHTLITIPPNYSIVNVLQIQGEHMTMRVPNTNPFLHLRMLSAEPFTVGRRVQLVELSFSNHGALAYYTHRIGMVRESRRDPDRTDGIFWMYDVDLFNVGEEHGLTLTNVRERHVRPAPLCESPDSGTSHDSD